MAVALCQVLMKRDENMEANREKDTSLAMCLMVKLVSILSVCEHQPIVIQFAE